MKMYCFLPVLFALLATSCRWYNSVAQKSISKYEGWVARLALTRDLPKSSPFSKSGWLTERGCGPITERFKSAAAGL